VKAAKGKILICAGHRIDDPLRVRVRFPAAAEARVVRAMSAILEAWGVGPGWVVHCGGAQGTDILAAELCISRGAEVQLHLALPEAEFLAESVRRPGADWEARYRALVKVVRRHFPKDRRGSRSALRDVNPYTTANRRMVRAAQAGGPPLSLYALLVWDGRKAGDGPGGTADMAARLLALAGNTCIINPIRMEVRNGNAKGKRAQPPYKLLALDGGGIRGLITLGILARMERELKGRWVAEGRIQEGDQFTLSQYFDYIGGTSTGAIIATCLSLGKSVGEITDFYEQGAGDMFAPSAYWDKTNHFYDARNLTARLRKEFEGLTLGSPELRTLLMVVLRNATTDSPWPLSNNPHAAYNLRSISDCNLDLPLWQIVRASTAAPVYFPPEVAQVGSKRFIFVDGGVTPYNNPAFQLFLMATLEPYKLGWKPGEENMLLVSVGTGTAPGEDLLLTPSDMHHYYNFTKLPKIFGYAAQCQQDLLCQAFGRCRAGEAIDREVRSLAPPLDGWASVDHGLPKLFTYLRYSPSLTENGVYGDLEMPRNTDLEAVRKLDSVSSIDALREIGTRYGKRGIKADHFRGF